MGTGDLVQTPLKPSAYAPLTHPAELTSSDLSAWNLLVIGIRAYSSRPELATAQPRSMPLSATVAR